MQSAQTQFIGSNPPNVNGRLGARSRAPSACAQGATPPSIRRRSHAHPDSEVAPVPTSPKTTAAQLQIAVFIDFENIALGLRDANAPFEVRRILDRLLEKGK